MKLAFTLTALSVAVLNAVAAVATESESRLSDMLRECRTSEGCSLLGLALSALRRGVANPQAAFLYSVDGMGVLKTTSYNRNANQLMWMEKGMLVIEGERNALWNDELQGVMEALRESGAVPETYETSDTRLTPYETLWDYIYNRGGYAERVAYIQNYYTPSGEFTGRCPEREALEALGLRRGDVITLASFPLAKDWEGGDEWDEWDGVGEYYPRSTKVGKPLHLR